MSARDDDAAWKAIVDNYGERPSLTDWEDADGPDTGAGSASPEERRGDFEGGPESHETSLSAESARGPWDEDEDEEEFVPPPPPPLPRAAPLRQAAWAGTLGAPLVLLVVAVLGVRPPVLVSLGLCLAFVVGFVYLVASMDPGPRDPWDNGARL